VEVPETIRIEQSSRNFPAFFFLVLGVAMLGGGLYGLIERVGFSSDVTSDLWPIWIGLTVLGAILTPVCAHAVFSPYTLVMSISKNQIVLEDRSLFTPRTRAFDPSDIVEIKTDSDNDYYIITKDRASHRIDGVLTYWRGKEILHDLACVHPHILISQYGVHSER